MGLSVLASGTRVSLQVLHTSQHATQDVPKSCYVKFRRKWRKQIWWTKFLWEGQEKYSPPDKSHDVTLACDDNRNILTHKVILMAIT